jgi:hypothetical protein
MPSLRPPLEACVQARTVACLLAQAVDSARKRNSPTLGYLTDAHDEAVRLVALLDSIADIVPFADGDCNLASISLRAASSPATRASGELT